MGVKGLEENGRQRWITFSLLRIKSWRLTVVRESVHATRWVTFLKMELKLRQALPDAGHAQSPESPTPFVFYGLLKKCSLTNVRHVAEVRLCEKSWTTKNNSEKHFCIWLV